MKGASLFRSDCRLHTLELRAERVLMISKDGEEMTLFISLSTVYVNQCVSVCV